MALFVFFTGTARAWVITAHFTFAGLRGQILRGGVSTHEGTWNAVCLADFGDSGAAFVALLGLIFLFLWIHLAVQIILAGGAVIMAWEDMRHRRL